MRRLVLSLALVALAAAPAVAAPPQGYLSQEDRPDTTRILPPPPAAGSPTQRADEAVIRATRRLDPGPRWNLAASDAVTSPDAVLSDFACALGVTLDARRVPALATLLSRIGPDLGAAVGRPKDLYHRTRPLVGRTYPICVTRDRRLEESGSYPSGHSTLGWTYALILAELAPDRSTEILMRGRAYGESRVVCGVHYPSDVEAGRTTAASLVAALHGNAEFRADMDKARAEIAVGRRTAPAASQCKVADEAAAHRPW